MLLSALSVLVVAQSSSEIPEGLMNNPVVQAVLQAHYCTYINTDHFAYSKGSSAGAAVHLPEHCLFIYSKVSYYRHSCTHTLYKQ